MAVWSPSITVMARAAYKAAKGLVRDFGEVEQLQVSQKGPSDFVSSADITAERTLRQELQRARPNYGMLLEEGGAVEGSDPRHRWIVDPLDGTLNYLHGLPHWAISIGLERDGDMVAGVVYDPLRDELFWAERGVGAFVTDPRQKDRRLRVSGRRRLADAVVGTGIPGPLKDSSPHYHDMVRASMAATAGVRRWGSAALDMAYVAAGRFDAFWEFGLKPWDIAAGLVLVREAGGFVGEIGGGTDMMVSGSVLATNDHFQVQMGELLRRTMHATATE